MSKFQRLLKPETEQEKQKQQILILLLIAGIVFYRFVYLPQEETKQLERQIQETIGKVANTPKPEEYSSLLTTCQSYLRWENGTAEQQTALENNKQNLDQAINWLKHAERTMADENAETRTREEEEKKQKEMEMIKKKKLHWRRPRNKRSWTENWLVRKKESFENVLRRLGGVENINTFDVAADYNIHFPPYLWNKLSDEQQKLAKSKGHSELELDTKTRSFRWNKLIEDWYNKVISDPVRGEQDPITEKDNNALLYGAGGTGKTSIIRKLAYNADRYPLIEIKGSSLTPRKEDYTNGIDPLNKFIFTLCDIENTLEDDFNFKREENGEVRYILFVDEADNVCSNTALPTEYTKLTFLKACMEGISKESQSQNLWIFATNYLHLIDPPVYRPGRLSNPLDFSWTLGDFKKYCGETRINNHFPIHWLKTNTLNDEDNKWVNRFNAMSFKDEFLPFFRKFITNSDTQKQLKEEKKTDDKGEEKIIKKGIQIGEMLEFFWRLFDSKQLENFDGKFENPRKPTTEEIIPTITEAIDVRLKELNAQASKIKLELEAANKDNIQTIGLNFKLIADMLAEIGKRME